MQQQAPSRDQLLLKIGAAKKEAGRAYSLVTIRLPKANETVNENTFQFSLNRKKLLQVRLREGRYLLRSNISEESPATLWRHYILLTEVEQAFKELNLALPPQPPPKIRLNGTHSETSAVATL